MTDTYTSGVWAVKAGEEEAFVQEWVAFVEWASSQPESGTFRLLRDIDHPRRYMSIGDWKSLQAQENWKNLPEFRERIGRVISHCDEFTPTSYEVVATV